MQANQSNLFCLQVDIHSRGAGDEAGDQVLRLRMSPHNVPEVSRVEMLADCPVDHPFFVKDKGESLHINFTELDIQTQRIIGERI